MNAPGTQLAGRYRLDERIGAGGMGEVWRGTDEVLGRTVAVKLMLPALLHEPGFAERFRGEARTMANLKHPGVVDVYDYHSDDAHTAFLVMEYVAGDPLSRTLRDVGRLTAVRTMALVGQAAAALQAAHDKGIVHRDVKPGNLLVRPDGTLVLTDFGIARSAATSQLTATGAVLGTASYISPEQAIGRGATPLSDVYALGVVAYECLAGRRPFEGDNPVEIALRHQQDAPPPLPADIPAAVRDVVMRALAKDPAHRWPSAAQFAAAARHVTATGSATGPATAARTALPVSPPPMSSPPVSPSPMSPPPVPAQAGAGVPRPPAAGAGTFRPGSAQVGGGGRTAAPADQMTSYPPYHAPQPYRPYPTPDRPSAIFIATMVLVVLAVLLFAGLAGYVARQISDGAEFADLFPMIAFVQYVEGSMTR
jgi:eukaryotic-like serine/threonine-protein kinase